MGQENCRERGVLKNHITGEKSRTFAQRQHMTDTSLLMSPREIDLILSPSLPTDGHGRDNLRALYFAQRMWGKLPNMTFTGSIHSVQY